LDDSCSSSLAGYKVDIIPEPLFWYRVLPEINVSFGSDYEKQQLNIAAYCDNMPPYFIIYLTHFADHRLSKRNTGQ
jgi:hypothetical protein